METERKEAAMEGVGEIPPTAVAATPREAEVKEMAEISAAPSETGQLQHEREWCWYRLVLAILTQLMILWSVRDPV
jgi:hypothetical protein